MRATARTLGVVAIVLFSAESGWGQAGKTLNACQQSVGKEVSRYSAGYQRAVGDCLNAIATALVQKGDPIADAASACASDLAKLENTKSPHKALVSKLRGKLGKACDPSHPKSKAQHSEGDILGTDADVPEPLNAATLGDWCGSFGASDTILGFDDWLTCLIDAATCRAQSELATDYPRMAEWLEAVRGPIAALDPDGTDVGNLDALIVLDTILLALDADQDGRLDLGCGPSRSPGPPAGCDGVEGSPEVTSAAIFTYDLDAANAYTLAFDGSVVLDLAQLVLTPINGGSGTLGDLTISPQGSGATYSVVLDPAGAWANGDRYVLEIPSSAVAHLCGGEAAEGFALDIFVSNCLSGGAPVAINPSTDDIAPGSSVYRVVFDTEVFGPGSGVFSLVSVSGAGNAQIVETSTTDRIRHSLVIEGLVDDEVYALQVGEGFVDNCGVAVDPGVVTTLTVTQCAEGPCLNDGACIDEGTTVRCECPEGFEGATCEVNIDDCAPEPCLNGGTCMDGVADYHCDCSAGFAGKDCELSTEGCGDGIVDAGVGETCDDGAADSAVHCPTAQTCTSDDPCRIATFSGYPEACRSSCEVVTRIGYGYTTCDDGDACTIDSQTGGSAAGCDVQCSHAIPPDPGGVGFIDRACDGIEGEAPHLVFVAKNGSDATGSGSPIDPMGSIGGGIQRALALQTTTDADWGVGVGVGVYEEQVRVQSGVSMYGGYVPGDSWRRTRAEATEIRWGQVEDNSIEAVLAEYIAVPTTLDRFTITALDAPGTSGCAEPPCPGYVFGVSTYGLRVFWAYPDEIHPPIPGDTLTLVDLTVTAGNGSDGADGVEGRDGGPGDPGAPGSSGRFDTSPFADVPQSGGQGGYGGSGSDCTYDCSPGGGCTSNGQPAAGSGGRGGDGGADYAWGCAGGENGTAGSPGSNGAPGGEAGDACGCFGDEGAFPGPGGSAGSSVVNPTCAAGAASATIGEDSDGHWRSVAGNPGGSGIPGAGGGGSGGHASGCNDLAVGATGAGGDGGGSGGCAGRGGGGGAGGGGSFGLFIVHASGLTITRSHFASSNGGAGGDGGDGGAGGAGGSSIGRGGQGQAGSAGAPGAGGAGGVSLAQHLCAVYDDMTGLNEATGTAGTPGTGGAGGTAPDGCAGPAGPNGQAIAYHDYCGLHE